MTDSSFQKTEEAILETAEDPEARLRTWLRERDRMGALVESHAALDDALARGYATGLSEGRAEGLDAARTTLFRMLEAKFGDLNESTLEKIEEARHPILRKYMLAVLDASSIEEVLALKIQS